MRVLSSVCLLSVALLAGCSSASKTMDVFSKDAQRAQPSSPEVAYAQLDSAPLCCRDLRELDYQLITEAGSVKVTMGPNMQAFRFATGKSFVKGFELPEFAKDKMKVSVESPVLEMVFMPNVLLLDENYQPVRVYGNDELRFSKRGVASANRYTLDIRIDVDREQALEARYLVLFTTDEQMQSATKLDKKLDTESAERLGSEMQMIKAMRGEYAAHVPAGLVKFNFQYEPSDKQSATKARQVLAETSTEQNKAASVLVATEAATVTPAPQTVVVDNKQPVSQNVSRTGRTIQPETEAMFISLIEQAVANDDLDTALQFVEEAERLGSTKVRGAFIDAFKSR